MKTYSIRNPKTGKIIENYVLNVYDDKLEIISYKRLKPYSIAITNYTDNTGYTFQKVFLDKCYVLSNIVYTSVTGNIIKSNNIIHHKDLNALNNMPNNLVEVTLDEHRIIHAMIHLRKVHHSSFMKIKELVEYAEMKNAIIS